MGRPRKLKYFCKKCGDGFPTPQALGGHVASNHPKKKKKKKAEKEGADDFPVIEIQSINSDGEEITIPIRIKIIVEVVTE